MVRLIEYWLPIVAMTAMIGPMLFYREKRLSPLKVRVAPAYRSSGKSYDPR